MVNLSVSLSKALSRTGVTAVVSHSGNLFQQKVACGIHVGNAFGKLAGSTQVAELGTLETPILLTNTLSVAEGIAQPRRATGSPQLMNA